MWSLFGGGVSLRGFESMGLDSGMAVGWGSGGDDVARVEKAEMGAG